MITSSGLDIQLELQAQQRDRLRCGGKRLSYDCVNLKVKGKKALCGRGMGVEMPVSTVERGVTSSKCKECGLFDGDTGMEA